LRGGRKNGQYANTRAQFCVLLTRPFCFYAEDVLIEVHKPTDVRGYQTGVCQNRIRWRLRVIGACVVYLPSATAVDRLRNFALQAGIEA